MNLQKVFLLLHLPISPSPVLPGLVLDCLQVESRAIAMQGLGFLPTFLYYFVCATLIGAIVLAKGLDMSMQSGEPLRIGLIFGVLAGLLGAFANRHTTVSISFQQRQVFVNRLGTVLQGMGYVEQGQDADTIVYSRAALSGFFSGKLYVHIEDQVATLSGRANTLRALCPRLEGDRD